MEDVLLEKFLKGDPLLDKRLRQIVLDFVTKTGGYADDAKEVYQIVSVRICDQSQRTLSQHVGKAFKTWLSKHRKDPVYVADRVRQLQTALDGIFTGRPDLLAALRKKEEAAIGQFTDIARATILLFVEDEGGDAATASDIIAGAQEKFQRVILDFTDYFLKSCKNQWFHLKKKRGLIRPEEEITHLSAEDEAEADMYELKNLILNLLNKASDACRKLLHQHYLEGKTKNELMNILGYSNPGSFDVAKSRCLSALRAEVKKYPYLKQAFA